MNLNTQGYVCVFNRDRDSYEAAVALREAGMLVKLVTDYYDRSARWAVAPGMRHRRAHGLPPALVQGSLSAVARQYLMRKDILSEREHLKIERMLSKRALKVAMQAGSGVFAYSGCAREAFEALPDTAHRVLFVYHPHARVSHEILSKDLALHPYVRWSFEHDADLAHLAYRSERLDRELALADQVIVASSFTAESIRPFPSSIAAYGASPSTAQTPRRKPARKVQFLFVGQGVQRKGLHHLFEAWREAKLSHSELTVVTSVMDPGIAERMPPDVSTRSHLSKTDLTAIYSRSDVFVLPSLIEGFGLVLLEALAQGCHIAATQNTGLPDLALGPDRGTLLPLNSPSQLAQSLRELEASQLDGSLAAPDDSHVRSWPEFRIAIQEALPPQSITGVASTSQPS